MALSRVLERVLMEYIDSVCSLESTLFFDSICSVEIRSRIRDIQLKPLLRFTDLEV